VNGMASTRMRLTHCTWLVLLFGLFSVAHAKAERWTVLGPDGGDARSLAFDPRNPNRIFLGTGTGTMFVSIDGGRNWSHFAHLGQGDSYVLDHIVIDQQNPDTVFVSAWSLENPKTGDLFRSRDGGATWEALSGLRGKSIRALTVAASESRIVVAGSLEGVYRSQDGGDSWQQISPENHTEIKNIESIAVDPKDPNVVYAGTWHLAWKTGDGGATWRHINKGMVDDSDVFSIIVDSANSSVVFASACSGIYRSDTAGDVFHKIQGIPFSARRTRVLKQDPSNPSIVYAGTTEGLWKTADGGKTWKRMTDPEIVVNDVLVDPRNSTRVLLATDRGGVIASDNGGVTFSASNHGYTHRYVSAIVVDKDDHDTIFVGIVNDREWGGVFSFRYGGQHWQQKSSGLGGRDVFSLKQAADGALIAGTNRGIFILDQNGNSWRSSNNTIPGDKPVSRKSSGARIEVRSALDTRVNEVDVVGGRWLAATATGIFASSNSGKTWVGGAVLDRHDFVSVSSTGDLEVAATRSEVLISKNAGTEWYLSEVPPALVGIRGVTLTADGQILIASREGGFRSLDAGATWERMLNGLPARDISSIAYDQERKRLLATSMSTSFVFESTDGGRSWREGADSGYPLRRINVMGKRFVAATPFDGVIIQP
jgi:photosystem II stability/assembly factor-like uncharacterized protein